MFHENLSEYINAIRWTINYCTVKMKTTCKQITAKTTRYKNSGNVTNKCPKNDGTNN